MSWDTVSPGYRPLSWGYPGILRMPPVSHDANLRFHFKATKKRVAGREWGKLLAGSGPVDRRNEPMSALGAPLLSAAK